MDEHDTTWWDLADVRTLKTLRAQGLQLPKRELPKRTGQTRQMRESSAAWGLSLCSFTFLTFIFTFLLIHFQKLPLFFFNFHIFKSPLCMFSKTPISLLTMPLQPFCHKNNQSEVFNHLSFNNTTAANEKLSWF